MFATLLGPLPRPPLPRGATVDDLVAAALDAQVAAGLEPLTDGGFRGPDDPVAAWRATAALTELAVKQSVVGPYTYGRSAGGPAADRAAATLARAATLNEVLRDLAAAGCPLVEVHEPAATEIGADPDERALFAAAHQRSLDGVTGTHLSLAITGGNADVAGIETLLAAPYASLALDLVAGPENWHLVRRTPGDRGIVCGALPVEAGTYDGPEPLLWAAGYAASSGGRGPDRVGLATAASLANLPWEAAVDKLRHLGDALRIAGLAPDERLRSLDPRAVSSRSAALGEVGPDPSRRPVRPVDPT